MLIITSVSMHDIAEESIHWTDVSHFALAGLGQCTGRTVCYEQWPAGPLAMSIVRPDHYQWRDVYVASAMRMGAHHSLIQTIIQSRPHHDTIMHVPLSSMLSSARKNKTIPLEDFAVHVGLSHSSLSNIVGKAYWLYKVNIVHLYPTPPLTP